MLFRLALRFIAFLVVTLVEESMVIGSDMRAAFSVDLLLLARGIVVYRSGFETRKTNETTSFESKWKVSDVLQ